MPIPRRTAISLFEQPSARHRNMANSRSKGAPWRIPAACPSREPKASTSSVTSGEGMNLSPAAMSRSIETRAAGLELHDSTASTPAMKASRRWWRSQWSHNSAICAELWSCRRLVMVASPCWSTGASKTSTCSSASLSAGIGPAGACTCDPTTNPAPLSICSRPAARSSELLRITTLTGAPCTASPGTDRDIESACDGARTSRGGMGRLERLSPSFVNSGDPAAHDER